MTVSGSFGIDVIREGADEGTIIDGKIASQQLLAEVKRRTDTLAAEGVKPGLGMVLVGENPASQVYVKAKGKAAKEAAFHSVQHDLPTSEADILKLDGDGRAFAHQGLRRRCPHRRPRRRGGQAPRDGEGLLD